MFLSKISQDNRMLFLQLSTHAALLNNDLAKDHEDIIIAQSKAMGIDDYKIEINTDINTLIQEIKENSSQQEVYIILFEIATLIMSDNKYDSLERQFINNLQDKLDVSKEKLTNMLYLINQLMGDYRSILNEED
ncbi:hypothetical protein [Romboutsia sp.]|uniref:hypothetical protein n=1 Tax=Romboutsia sp. TaxID=1965302 RepID=UPI003F378AF4